MFFQPADAERPPRSTDDGRQLPAITLSLLASFFLTGFSAMAQAPEPTSSPAPEQQPIARTSATTVKVSGAVDLHGGQMLLGNGSTVTADSEPVEIDLTRGGKVRICSTTSLHLARDRSVPAADNTALMMALDRGALETNFATGKYSDVLLTPDLRILISGPGEAALSVRVNAEGDTCVDNHGADAPYVTVTSQLEEGLYRVLPNQRVLFEHGSLKEVVDQESETCGCPPVPAVSVAGTQAPASGAGKQAGSKPDTDFPLAVSEGLAPPPAPVSAPVVPTGTAHAEVTVPLTYHGDSGAPAAQQASPSAAPSSISEAGASGSGGPVFTGSTSPGQRTAAAAASQGPAPTEQALRPQGASAAPAVISPVPSPAPQKGAGFFHRVGHFFALLFGG